MSFYQTPVKQAAKKQTHIYTQDRPTDWICVVCNNLNFSFRKKCNRCKTQTRTQNENQIANALSQYSYYYNSGSYVTAGKYPLGDITNCYTPQEKQTKNQQENIKDFELGLSEHKDSATDQIISKISTNILDNQCWKSINDDPQDFEQYNKTTQEQSKQGEDQAEQMEIQIEIQMQCSSRKKLKFNSSMKAHSRSGVLKSKREEKAICEFTDTELEYLVNKILVED